MEKVGIYVRVSTEKQVKEGYSISAQINNLTKYAMNNNWFIYNIYKDEGKSAKNIKDRPDILRLIEDIKLKKIDKLLLYKFDRLTRNSLDVEEIMNLVSIYPVDIITYSGGQLDVKSATGRLMVRMNGAFAQYERETTIERIKVALIEKVKSGYALCNCYTSYGYDRKKGEKIQTINKEEAKVVKEIFKLFINGIDPLEIAKYLNLKNIPTKAKGKKRIINNKEVVNKGIWYAKTIKEILKNPTYIGKVRYSCNEKNNYFEVLGKHEAIIDEKTYIEANKKLETLKKVYQTKRPKDKFYCLGTIKCICNVLMKSKTVVKNLKKGKTYYDYYFCPNCKKSISIKKIENAILKENIKIKQEKEMLKWQENIIKLYKEKEKEIMNAYLKNEITLEKMNYLIENIKKEQIEFNCNEDNNNLKSFKDFTNIEKREYVLKYINEIVFNNGGVLIVKK